MSAFPRLSSTRRLWRSGAILGASLFVSVLGTVHAASSKQKQAPKDSAPVLLSRTGGGGGMWSDMKELEQAAAKGNPKAEAQFGEMLLRGDGIAADASRGVALLEKSARAGNSAAAFRIGMLLANGEHGAAKDPARALAYFRAAAAGGEKEAFFNIGAAYASARGVRRDYGEALGWLIVARLHGADAAAEQKLRTQIKAQPAWIARGERRAKEIEQEFAGKTVADYLPPPAPLDQVASTPSATETASRSAPTAQVQPPRPTIAAPEIAKPAPHETKPAPPPLTLPPIK
jgi:hypothetical protein